MKAVIVLTQGPHVGLSVIIGDIPDDVAGKPPEALSNVNIPGLNYTVEFASLIRVKRPIVYYREAFAKPMGKLGQTMETWDPKQR